MIQNISPTVHYACIYNSTLSTKENVIKQIKLIIVLLQSNRPIINTCVKDSHDDIGPTATLAYIP